MLATMQSSSPLLPSSASAPSSAVSSLDFALDAFTADASLVFVSSGVSAVGSEIRPFLKNLSTPSVESEESVLLTRGDSSLVLESVLTLIHDEPCEWLLPGVKPTNRRLVVPLVTSTSFRDGKVASRRVYWDQASVLKQLGVLPNSLYCKASSSEMTLPVLNIRVADKLREFAPATITDDVPPMESPLVNPLISAVQSMDLSNMVSRSPVAAGLSSREANEQHNHQLRSPAPKSAFTEDHMEGILSASRPSTANTDYRSSTKMFAQPKSNVFDQEPEPLRTSIPIDPRRFQNQLNLFDDSPFVAPKIQRSDPNRMSTATTEQVDRPHGRRVFKDANVSHIFDEPTVEEPHMTRIRSHNTSQISFFKGDNEASAPTTRPTSRGHVKDNNGRVIDQNQSHFSFGNETGETLYRSGKKIENTAFRSSQEDDYRPSSRVLGPPGGASKLVLG